MSISIFDIPPIYDTITQYLTRHDLSQCVLVSQEWLTWFSSALWQTFYIQGATSTTIESLKRNSHCIRSFISHQSRLISILGRISISLSFPNLTSIDYTPNNIDPNDDTSVLLLVQATPLLQSLSMKFGQFRKMNHTKLIHTLETHPNLRKVDLVCYITTPSIKAIQQIIQTCCRFESVNIDFRSHQQIGPLEEDEQRAQLKIASEEFQQMEETRIRDLSIKFLSTDHQSTFLPSLLEKSLLLEKLEWDYLQDDETLERAVGIIGDKLYSTLKHVRIGNGSCFFIDENPVVEIIQSLGQNKPDDSWRDSLRRRGLEAFSVNPTVAIDRRAALSLIRYHADTLVFLDLCHNRYLRIQLFALLVSNLPQLQFLTAAISIRFLDEGDSDMEKLLITPWTCLSIKCLDLAIGIGIMEYNMTSWLGSIGDRCITYIFSQIGRFSQLEEWSLVGPRDILAVRRTYLNHLSDLKALKSLSFGCSNDIDISESDADWMLNNWPRWTHLTMFERTFRRWKFDQNYEQFSEYTLGLRRIMEARPWMRICGHFPDSVRHWPVELTLGSCICYDKIVDKEWTKRSQMHHHINGFPGIF